MKEIFKDIPGYEGLYSVTDMGRVWSYKRGKFLVPINANGYLKVFLFNGGKRRKFPIHRLVLMTFLPIDNANEMQCNHINEIKTDNRLENLEWSTNSENINHGTRNQRCREKKCVPILCVETGEVYLGTRDAERQTGVNYTDICLCCNGKLKTAGGYHWEKISQNS